MVDLVSSVAVIEAVVVCVTFAVTLTSAMDGVRLEEYQAVVAVYRAGERVFVVLHRMGQRDSRVIDGVACIARSKD